MKKKVKLELYKEYPEPNEEEVTKKLTELLKKLIEKDYLTGTTYRDTHAKGHAAVKAEFIVEPGLPEDLRVGLFKEARSYSAWIRFSNLNPSPQADINRDIRAMAIKLMEVDGKMLWEDEKNAKTLDIIMMASQTFLAPNLAQFYDLEAAIYKGGPSVLWFFLTHFRIARTILAGRQKCANLLEVPYWSQTAYAYGPKAVQYHLKPCSNKTSNIPKKPKNNYLREKLKEQLAQEEVRFDFMIQFQTNPYKMPIENPIVAWDETLSPYRKVATIKILPQSFDSPAQMEFCENLSFNPWRTFPEHKPLGGINRARKSVYPAISKFRHYKNFALDKEPTPDTFTTELKE